MKNVLAYTINIRVQIVDKSLQLFVNHIVISFHFRGNLQKQRLFGLDKLATIFPQSPLRVTLRE